MNKPELEPEIKMYHQNKNGTFDAQLYRDKYVRVHTQVKLRYNPWTNHIGVHSSFGKW